MDMGIHWVTSIVITHKKANNGMKFSKVVIMEKDVINNHDIKHELTFFPHGTDHVEIEVIRE